MELYRMAATGPRAIGVVATLGVVYAVATGYRFAGVCDRLERYADNISTEIAAREMGELAGALNGKAISEIVADTSMARRVDELHVSISALTCADTFVLGIVCHVTYRLGAVALDASSHQGYFALFRSGRFNGWTSQLQLRQPLFSHSPRRCSMNPDRSPGATTAGQRSCDAVTLSSTTTTSVASRGVMGWNHAWIRVIQCARSIALTAGTWSAVRRSIT